WSPVLPSGPGQVGALGFLGCLDALHGVEPVRAHPAQRRDDQVAELAGEVGLYGVGRAAAPAGVTEGAGEVPADAQDRLGDVLVVRRQVDRGSAGGQLGQARVGRAGPGHDSPRLPRAISAAIDIASRSTPCGLAFGSASMSWSSASISAATRSRTCRS